MTGAPDSLFSRLDTLCRIPSWWRPAPTVGGVPRHNEMALAEHIAGQLRQHAPWLTVRIEEAAPGRPNLLAFDGDPTATEVLICGHLDTVPPSTGWTLAEHSVENNRYHALGAADTKGAIAAAVQAIIEAGPTSGVGLLLYADEEYEFVGMKHFVAHHTKVRPDVILSLCGAPAKIMSGCRGLLEVGISLRGHGGHASRPSSGRSATHALHAVLSNVATWVAGLDAPVRTVVNVAALQAGSLPAGQGFRDGPPVVEAIPNRIPDAAWALLELRTGSDAATATALRQVIEDTLLRVNFGTDLPVVLERFDVRQQLPGYSSDPARLARVTQPFTSLHQGRIAHPSTTGYLDVALLCGRDGTPALCMGPEKGGAHAPDEWVDLASLRAYKDGLVSLLHQQPRLG